MTPAEIKKLAAISRECYCRCVREHHQTSGKDSDYGLTPLPRWDGGIDNQGVEHENVWLRVADFLYLHLVDPYDYIYFVFRKYGLSRYPTPIQLCNERYITDFNYRTLSGCENLARQFKELFGRFDIYFRARHKTIADYRIPNMGWSEQMVSECCIQDETLGYTPLYQFMKSFQLGLNDTAKQYRDEALVEYYQNKPAFDLAFGDSLPEDFKQEACRIYSIYLDDQLLECGHPVIRKAGRNVEV